jgi:hypothetical protein
VDWSAYRLEEGMLSVPDLAGFGMALSTMQQAAVV